MNLSTNCNNLTVKEVSKVRRCLPQIIAVCIKNILLLVYGLTMGMPAMLIPNLGGEVDGETIVLDENGLSWVGSISFLSVPIGCFASRVATKPFGRIRSMQILCVLFFGAFLILHFASQAWHIFLSLFLTGLTGGLLEAPTLIYAVEITEPGSRGALISTTNLAVCLGVVQSFILGSIFPWRTIALINGLIPLVTVFLLFLIPEPPQWLIRSGNFDKARKNLAWLRGWTTVGNIEKEFQLMLHEIEQKKLEKPQTLMESAKSFFRPTFLKPFCLVCLTFVLGSFGLFQSAYAVNTFQILHAPIDSYYATILLGASQLMGSIILMILVRFLGKRLLCFISQLSIFIVFSCVGIYAYSTGANYFDSTLNNLNEALVNKYSWVPLVGIAAANFFSFVMPLTLPWILMGELFPNDIRDAAAGLGAAVGYYIGFLVNKTFLDLVNLVTLAGVFWINSSVTLIGFGLMYFLLPETEGKKLNEITDHYAGRRKLSNNVRRKKGVDNKGFEGDDDSQL